MSRSYWLSAIALGLIFFVHLGQAQEQPQPAQGQAETQQRPAQDFYSPIRVEIVEDKAAAESRKRREEEAAQREKEDLIAQKGMNAATQAMNDATQRMADYSWWSVFFVALGTALLIVTLLLTWQANRAAVESVRVQRQIGQAQIRAYLGVEGARLDEDRFRIWLQIKNFGQTPASDVSVKTVCIVGGTERESQLHGFGIVDPGVATPAVIKVAPEDIVFIANNPDTPLIVRVTISYSDVNQDSWCKTAKYFCPRSLAENGHFALYVVGGSAKERKVEKKTG